MLEPNKNSDRNDKNVLIEQYKLIYSTLSQNFDVYFKSTTMLFFLLMASLGFIMKAEISLLYIRFISTIILTIGLVWLIGTLLAIKYIKLIENETRDIASQLGISHFKTITFPFRVVLTCYLCSCIPLAVVFIYFVF